MRIARYRVKWMRRQRPNPLPARVLVAVRWCSTVRMTRLWRGACAPGAGRRSTQHCSVTQEEDVANHVNLRVDFCRGPDPAVLFGQRKRGPSNCDDLLRKKILNEEVTASSERTGKSVEGKCLGWREAASLSRRGLLAS